MPKQTYSTHTVLTHTHKQTVWDTPKIHIQYTHTNTKIHMSTHTYRAHVHTQKHTGLHTPPVHIQYTNTPTVHTLSVHTHTQFPGDRHMRTSLLMWPSLLMSYRLKVHSSFSLTEPRSRVDRAVTKSWGGEEERERKERKDPPVPKPP